MSNTRYIEITKSITVGYNYIKSQFYVQSLDTQTYRDTVEDVQEVLRAVLPVGIPNPSDEEIQALKDELETLESIYYTWHNNGAYISSIQFNNFKDFPIELDCEKKRLFIKNSTTIFDLTTNESPKIVRIPILCSYYKDTLGLDIPREVMLGIYRLLIGFYNPTCYNQIATREDTKELLKYSNTFAITNYDNSSDVVFNGTKNPYNTLIESENTFYISSIDNTSNTITLSSNSHDIEIGDKVVIAGCSTTLNSTEYSADGIYTVQDIAENTITTEETLPINYEYPYYTCYVLAYSSNITSISRDNNTITVTDTPINILIGDKVHVKGTTITTEFEEISCDGSYTVSNIIGNTITVEETIPTDFSGSNATLTKEIFISKVYSMVNNTIYLTSLPNFSINNLINNMVICYNSNIKDIGSYTVTDTSESNRTLTVAETITNEWTAELPTLRKLIPSEETLLNITDVEESLERIFPTGEFLLENYESAKEYLLTCTYIGSFKHQLRVIGENFLQEVPMTREIYALDFKTNQPIGEPIEMICLGLYNEIYPEIDEAPNHMGRRVL